MFSILWRSHCVLLVAFVSVNVFHPSITFSCKKVTEFLFKSQNKYHRTSAADDFESKYIYQVILYWYQYEPPFKRAHPEPEINITNKTIMFQAGVTTSIWLKSFCHHFIKNDMFYFIDVLERNNIIGSKFCLHLINDKLIIPYDTIPQDVAL